MTHQAETQSGVECQEKIVVDKSSCCNDHDGLVVRISTHEELDLSMKSNRSKNSLKVSSWTMGQRPSVEKNSGGVAEFLQEASILQHDGTLSVAEEEVQGGNVVEHSLSSRLSNSRPCASIDTCSGDKMKRRQTDESDMGTPRTGRTPGTPRCRTPGTPRSPNSGTMSTVFPYGQSETSDIDSMSEAGDGKTPEYMQPTIRRIANHQFGIIYASAKIAVWSLCFILPALLFKAGIEILLIGETSLIHLQDDARGVNLIERATLFHGRDYLLSVFVSWANMQIIISTSLYICMGSRVVKAIRVQVLGGCLLFGFYVLVLYLRCGLCLESIKLHFIWVSLIVNTLPSVLHYIYLKGFRWRSILRLVVPNVFAVFVGITTMMYMLVSNTLVDPLEEFLVMSLIVPAVQFIIRKLQKSTMKIFITKVKGAYDSGLFTTICESVLCGPGFVVLLSAANNFAFYTSMLVMLLLEVTSLWLFVQSLEKASRIRHFGSNESKGKISSRLRLDRATEIARKVRRKFGDYVLHHEIGEQSSYLISFGITICVAPDPLQTILRGLVGWGMIIIADSLKEILCFRMTIHIPSAESRFNKGIVHLLCYASSVSASCFAMITGLELFRYFYAR